jgi:hypothetical protein
MVVNRSKCMAKLNVEGVEFVGADYVYSLCCSICVYEISST